MYFQNGSRYNFVAYIIKLILKLKYFNIYFQLIWKLLQKVIVLTDEKFEWIDVQLYVLFPSQFGSDLFLFSTASIDYLLCENLFSSSYNIQYLFHLMAAAHNQSKITLWVQVTWYE